MHKIKASKFFFFIFFGIGSLLFLIQLIVQELSLVTIIGYYYLLLVLAINSLILLGLFISLIFEDNKLKTLKAMGIILLNLPIACLYLTIVLNHLL